MDEKRFTLRMDGDLYDEIADLAKNNRRSVAKEIEVAIYYHVLDRHAKAEAKSKYSEYSHDDLISLGLIHLMKSWQSRHKRFPSFLNEADYPEEMIKLTPED